MKMNFHLKLGICIVLVFGLLLAGFALYEPVWFKYYEWRLQSDDTATRDAAAAAITDKGEKAIPYVKKWLHSANDNLVNSACLLLEKMDGDIWKQALPELKLLIGKDYYSKKVAAAASLICMKKYGFKITVNNFMHEEAYEWYDFNNNARSRINISIFILSNLKSEVELQIFACRTLGATGDRSGVPYLIEIFESDSDYFLEEEVFWALGLIGGKRAESAVLKVLLRNVNKLEGTEDDDIESIVRAINTLGSVGGRPSVEALLKIIKRMYDIKRIYDMDICNAAFGALGVIGDSLAVEPLLELLVKPTPEELEEYEDFDREGILILDLHYKRYLVKALGYIGNPKAVEPLLSILENDAYIYSELTWTMFALGEIGDNRAIGPLIRLLENNSYSRWYSDAIDALVKIEPSIITRILPLLLKLFENKLASDTRASVIFAISEIGDNRAIEPLIRVIENDDDICNRNSAAFALAGFNDKRVEKILLKASKGYTGAAIAGLLWRNGLKNLEYIRRLKYNSYGFSMDEYLNLALLRWGDSSVYNDVTDILYYLPNFRKYYLDVFSRMPEGCPEYDFKVNFAARRKKIKAMKAWYEKNKHRLAWNPDTRKYYLKSERGEKN